MNLNFKLTFSHFLAAPLIYLLNRPDQYRRDSPEYPETFSDQISPFQMVGDKAYFQFQGILFLADLLWLLDYYL